MLGAGAWGPQTTNSSSSNSSSARNREHHSARSRGAAAAAAAAREEGVPQSPVRTAWKKAKAGVKGLGAWYQGRESGHGWEEEVRGLGRERGGDRGRGQGWSGSGRGRGRGGGRGYDGLRDAAGLNAQSRGDRFYQRGPRHSRVLGELQEGRTRSSHEDPRSGRAAFEPHPGWPPTTSQQRPTGPEPPYSRGFVHASHLPGFASHRRQGPLGQHTGLPAPVAAPVPASAFPESQVVPSQELGEIKDASPISLSVLQSLSPTNWWVRFWKSGQQSAPSFAVPKSPDLSVGFLPDASPVRHQFSGDHYHSIAAVTGAQPQVQQIHLPVASHSSHSRVVDEAFALEYLVRLNSEHLPVLSEQDLRLLVGGSTVRPRLKALLGHPAVDVQVELQDILVQALLTHKEKVRATEDANRHHNRHIDINTTKARHATVEDWLSPVAPSPKTLEHVESMNTNPFAKAKASGNKAMPPPPTPTVDKFATEINNLIKARDMVTLGDFMTLMPQNMTSGSYLQMRQELQAVMENGKVDALETKIEGLLPAADEGADLASWKQFTRFFLKYLEYLRDVTLDESKYLAIYQTIMEMQQKANVALGHASLGHLMLPTTIKCAQLLAWLAITLDKRPDLTQHLNLGGGGEDGTERVSLPEQCVNILRTALTTCCQDRLGGLDANGVPSGKKAGIYKLANVMFKILFQCQNLLSASYFLENIFQQSPPLGAYPKGDRVTYLYYLGRFHFHHGHMWRAHLALQAAYDEAPAHESCLKQRRLMLIYLIASNIMLGRFPSATLFANAPEAFDLAPRFLPLCTALRTGNIALYRSQLAWNGPNYAFYMHYRMFLQLRNICETILRRVLVRQAFVLHASIPEIPTDPDVKIPYPTLDFSFLIPVIGPNSELAVSENPADIAPEYEGLTPEELQKYCGNRFTDTPVVMAGLLALVGQKLVNGFVNARARKLCIQGAGRKLAPGQKTVEVGFPTVYEVAKAAQKEDDVVPGWKVVVGDPSAGRVISLAGIGAVGA